MKHTPVLDIDQSEAIRSILDTQAKTMSDLATRSSISPGALSRILSGKLSLSPRNAGAIYRTLGKPSALQFLHDYSVDPHTYAQKHPLSHSGEECLWTPLYDRRVHDLKPVFLFASVDIKGQILGDLERLVEKYGKRE